MRTGERCGRGVIGREYLRFWMRMRLEVRLEFSNGMVMEGATLVESKSLEVASQRNKLNAQYFTTGSAEQREINVDDEITQFTQDFVDISDADDMEGRERGRVGVCRSTLFSMTGWVEMVYCHVGCDGRLEYSVILEVETEVGMRVGQMEGDSCCMRYSGLYCWNQSGIWYSGGRWMVYVYYTMVSMVGDGEVRDLSVRECSDMGHC
ncbi:hypothetical protein Tco_0851022 [Tanacetum coccineum]